MRSSDGCLVHINSCWLILGIHVRGTSRRRFAEQVGQTEEMGRGIPAQRGPSMQPRQRIGSPARPPTPPRSQLLQH